MLQVSLAAPALPGAVGFVGHGEVDAHGVLYRIFIRAGITFVVERCANQPGKYPASIGGIGNPAVLAETEQGSDVFTSGRAPVADAGGGTRPPLDSRQ